MVEAAFENRYNKLWVQSAYLSNKKEVVTQASDATVRSPMVTPETPPASPTSKVILSQDGEKVNNEGYAKGVISRSEVAPFKYGNNDIKAMPYIDEKDGIRTIGATKSMDEDAFVEGLWDGASNTNKNIVEKSQLENVENYDESDIIEEKKTLTLEDLTRDVLKAKPLYSPRPKRWIKNGGSIAIDNNGTWIYTDSNGVTVMYIDGYPDFESAGTVEQKVDIGGFRNRTSDAKLADKLAPNGPCKKGYVWHHSPDGCTMMMISEEIHKKFTHRGGYSLMKMKRRN